MQRRIVYQFPESNTIICRRSASVGLLRAKRTLGFEAAPFKVQARSRLTVGGPLSRVKLSAPINCCGGIDAVPSVRRRNVSTTCYQRRDACRIRNRNVIRRCYSNTSNAGTARWKCTHFPLLNCHRKSSLYSLCLIRP